jgi:hypothetical protein
MNLVLAKIIGKMCSMVGANYYEVMELNKKNKYEEELYHEWLESAPTASLSECELMRKSLIQTPLWYYSHQWTIEQQNEFTKWLTDYFMKDKTIRKMFPLAGANKKMSEETAEMFVFSYGWRIKKDDKEALESEHERLLSQNKG